MKEILREIDTSLDEYSLEQIIDEVDEDGSGTVDFDEFMAMMTGEWFFTNKSHFFNKKAQQPIPKLRILKFPEYFIQSDCFWQKKPEGINF